MFIKCEYCGTLNFFNKTGYCKNCDRRLNHNTNSSTPKATLNPKSSHETMVVECKVDKDTTIKRLIDMNGKCRETLINGIDIIFNCNKNGEFEVIPEDLEKLFYIAGKVCEENGRTKIYISAFRKKLNISRYLYPAFLLISIIIYIIMKIHLFKFTTIDILFLIIMLYTELNLLFTLKKLIKNFDENLSVMKSEVLKRIRAVEKWDE